MENPQRSLESTRQRMLQLIATLESFQVTLIRKQNDELPSWDHLQSHFTVLATTLDSLTTHLSHHFPPQFSSSPGLIAYPLPTFPPAKELLLTALMSKKASVDVADSVWEAVKASDSGEAEGVGTVGIADTEYIEKMESLWKSAIEIVGEIQDTWDWYSTINTTSITSAGTSEVEKEYSADAIEKEREKEMDMLTSLVRFWNTGVPIDEQAPLPKKR